jgi:hypothetical protein
VGELTVGRFRRSRRGSRENSRRPA